VWSIGMSHHDASAARGKLRLVSRSALRRLGILFAAIALLVGVLYVVAIWMPGRSHSGPLPDLTVQQQELAAQAQQSLRQLLVMALILRLLQLTL
jgi:hypothetical protein